MSVLSCPAATCGTQSPGQEIIWHDAEDVPRVIRLSCGHEFSRENVPPGTPSPILWVVEARWPDGAVTVIDAGDRVADGIEEAERSSANDDYTDANVVLTAYRQNTL